MHASDIVARRRRRSDNAVASELDWAAFGMVAVS